MTTTERASAHTSLLIHVRQLADAALHRLFFARTDAESNAAYAEMSQIKAWLTLLQEGPQV